MLSDAVLYQSAAHPDKARLLFNTQLHQTLKSIAKNRELVHVAPNATNTVRPVLSLRDPYGSSSAASFGRATELNGWDLEKKMVALQDICDLLQRPYFFYADWATQAAAAAAKTAPASLEKRMNALLYTSKTLPLRLGQTTLLDLWDYVMDMCDHVPVRNRCRALYLHVAACICRRVEFIDGYDVDDEHVHVDAEVTARYHQLLLRCVQFAAVKLSNARFLADDHKTFAAHVYTALYFRFPCTTSTLLTAVVDTTATLERRVHDESDDDGARDKATSADGQPESDDPSLTLPTSPTTEKGALPRLHVPTRGATRGRHRHRRSTLRGYRSPRGHCRHWNALPDSASESTAGPDKAAASSSDTPETMRHDAGDYERHMVLAKQQVFQAFGAYKTSRGTDDLLTESRATSSHKAFKRGVRSADASLERAFQQMLERASAQQEATFFDELPLLYSGNVTESQALAALGISRAELLDEVLEPFVDRLTTPGRDDLTAVTFITAFLNDVSSWCAHRSVRSHRSNNNADSSSDRGPRDRAGILWHCIPGYFALIRLFLAVFQLMCQRRPRMAAMPAPPASVARILSIVDGTASGSRGAQDDPWLAYWTGREVDVVLDAAAEVLKNDALTNVLVKIVLETTNMHDPVSVNYSFGILQRVLEIAAKSAAASRVSASGAAPPPSPPPVGSSSASTRKVRDPTHRLTPAFDDEYFVGVMRRALQSAHVQILLKVLTCLYNTIDLLPAHVRRRIIGELILRDHFFRFFMHWNEEIRKIFSYIIVFKTSVSNRLDLPCATDRILLAQSPYFEGASPSSLTTPLSASRSSSTASTASSPLSTLSSPASPVSPSTGYWSQLSDIAQSMLRATGSASSRSSSASDAAADKLAGARALERLVAWDASARLRKPRGSAHAVLFRDSLENDELSVDLSISSKLDALFKMLADQMSARRSYFPQPLEAYAARGLAQYVSVLSEYYDAAVATPSATPSAPTLAFTITTPVFTE